MPSSIKYFKRTDISRRFRLSGPVQLLQALLTHLAQSGLLQSTEFSGHYSVEPVSNNMLTKAVAQINVQMKRAYQSLYASHQEDDWGERPPSNRIPCSHYQVQLTGDPDRINSYLNRFVRDGGTIQVQS
ncbi:hypothetical protein [Tunicatimonas pelagia]|uniref:hypothetical protein n=1 Tax=Tunicatimonas pelagia TaxID=931531 RepID=UPI002666505A|nr:hypothetical protein [Tunicatimonas pelagia]WKN42210.1 hypothetical protein P0M28_24540 [Tunicatimonas pelagia]WKN45328.1 hypothetical protein P0M28_10190 [Tunicatimonas pelagia]